jgi:hypothetical protein
MDDIEREVFQMGQRAEELSDATQHDEEKRFLLEASETLLFAAKHMRTHNNSQTEH